MQTSNVRSRILVPTMFALIILLGAFVISAYWHQKRAIRDEVKTKLESVEELFTALLGVNASLMGAALKVIMRDSELKAAFREKDRESLYNKSSPLFEQLRSGHGITHFYFADPSRVNLLRVHKQGKYGDSIDRFTTLEAEKTGKLSYGIELGSLGTFTLRVVAPWHDGERLIGYVELGKEIEQIIGKLRTVLGVELYVFIKKEFLNRQDWEASMKLFGRDPAWNRHLSQVLTSGTLKIIPEELIRFLSKGDHLHEISGIEISLDNQIYVAKCLDLKDAAGRNVGDLLVLTDVTKEVADFRKSVFLIGIFCLGIGGALFTFFYAFLGRVEKQLSETQRRVLELERDRSKFILDNLPGHISLIDQNGCFAQWSTHSEKMFGYTSDEAIGRLRPEDVMQNRENAINMASPVKQKGFAEREIRGLRKDGTLPWLKFRMVEMHERDGTTSVLTIVEDITIRKQAEAALRESEEKFRVIFEQAAVGVSQVETETGRILRVNQKYSDIVGYTREDMARASIMEITHPDDLQISLDNIKRLIKGEIRNSTFEKRYIHKDGSIVWVNLTISPMWSVDEKPNYHIAVVEDITERKLTEEALRGSEEKYRTILDSIEEAYFEVDIAGNFTFFNDSLSTILGYSDDELVGMNNRDYMPPESSKKIHDVFNQIYRTGTPIKKVTYEIIRKDGGRGFHELSASLLKDQAGQPIGFRGIAHDITELKKAGDSLRENEERYRALFDRSLDLVYINDFEGNFMDANPAALDLLGYTREELDSLNFSSLLTEDQLPLALETLGELKEKGFQAELAEFRLKSKSGKDVYIETKSSVIYRDGKPFAVQGIARDITERKRSTELLGQAAKQWQNTFDAIKDMIVIVDKNRHIAQINQATRDTFPDLNLESPCYEIFHGVRVLPEGCVSCNVFETGQTVVSEYYDPRLKKWFDLYAYPIENAEGEVEQLVHVFRDITQQMKEAEEKEQLTLRIQRSEKMEAIGTLAGGVAHDLNNILGGIVGYPELMLMDLPENSKMRKPILAIQQSGLKATAVVQDLLTLARRGVVVNEVVDLNEIIVEYLKSPEFSGLKTYHPDIQIQTNLKEDLLNILGSPVHLSKTVMNLVSNAAEAITGKGTIKISSDHSYIDTPIRGYDKIEEGDYIILQVTDDGMGISSEHIDRIFEPFYTKKKMGRSGTGLGMAVVWGTVKDHKGYIDVRSTEGKGTTFTLYFPVTRKEVMERVTTGSIEDYLGNGESILVVDDVEEQRELASGMLRKLGYSVSTVSSGEGAIEYLKNNKTDLILLDMIMDPGIDGFETYKRILEMYPGQKAIIASGFSETERVKEAQRLGAGAYIKKPFLLEKLGIAIKEELEK